MKALLVWLVFVLIDVFKVLIVFIAIFGIASVTVALYVKDRCQLIYYGASPMKDFLGSLAIALVSTTIIIAVALYFFAKPAFEAMKGFHFG